MAEYTRKRANLLVKPQWDAVAKHESKGSFSLVEHAAANASNGNTLALQYDAEGRPMYEQVITQHLRKGKIAYTKPSDMKEKSFSSDELARPADDAVRENLAKTKEALQLALNKSNATTIEKSEPEVFRYTPHQNSQVGRGHAQVGQRLIKMTTRAVDPLEPSNIRHKKMPGNPPSPPAPVLHSPQRKLTKEDQANWKIPPCVSNWKNQKGYTLPIDKRVQADGRRLREVVINDKFASLSESLFIAERTAREEVRIRNEIIREEKLKEAKKREEELRELAAKAREERHRLYARDRSRSRSGSRDRDRDRDRPSRRRERARSRDSDEDEREELLKIEMERRRELEREWRLEKGIRKKRMGDRDVSEKIALGQAKPTKITDLYDARLLQGEGGLSSVGSRARAGLRRRRRRVVQRVRQAALRGPEHGQHLPALQGALRQVHRVGHRLRAGT